MLTIQKNNKKSLTISKRDFAPHIDNSGFVIMKLENANEIERVKVFYQQEKQMEKEPQWFKSYRKTDDRRWEEQMKFNKAIIERVSKIETIIEMLISLPTIKKELSSINIDNPKK